MSEVYVNSKPFKRMMKERKIKGVGPSINGDDVMPSKVENKIVTKWKSM